MHAARWVLALALALALLLHAVIWWELRNAWATFTPPSSLKRMEALYTRELQLSAQPPALARAARPSPAQAAPQAVPLAPAASAPLTEGVPAPPDGPSAPLPQHPAVASLAAASAAAAEPVAQAPSDPAVAVAAEAAPLPAFEWPLATRIQYRLVGQYRGEVQGRAQVEWLREGARYQVHLDVTAAGFFTRRMASEGRITPAGLAPERYVQVTEVFFGLFGKPKTEEMRMDGASIRLVNGQEVPTLPMVQDTASQFIQCIFLLSTDPALQRPGQGVSLALALPRSARHWSYEVGPSEEVPTPVGLVDTVHLRPASSASPGDWSIEMWFAPRLHMLPVRFRIRQSAEVYFDLFIDHLPEQAAR